MACDKDEPTINKIQANIDGTLWVGDPELSHYLLTETDNYQLLGDDIDELLIFLSSDTYSLWLSGPFLLKDSLKIVQGQTLELDTYSGAMLNIHNLDGASLPTKSGYLTSLSITDNILTGEFEFTAGFKGEEQESHLTNGIFELHMKSP